jgi:uncharacterized membrane protein
MQRPDLTIDLILLCIIFNLIVGGTAFSQDNPDESAALNQLVLNVYLDDSGKALINGYVDDPALLAFLNSSQYTYDDYSGQLYAITNALSSKFKDNWTMSFESKGSYDDYHIMFYLPEIAQLKRINCTSGLDCLVYAANKSVVAEVQGGDIRNPAVNIEYLLPLVEVSRAKTDMVASTDVGYPYKTIALVFLLITGSGFLIFLLRSRSVSMTPADCLEPHAQTIAPTASEPNEPDLSDSIAQQIDAADHLAITLNEDIESSSKISTNVKASELYEKRGASIELTKDISAVMDTLTDKEQSVLRALLQRGGTMTQTEIRYETDISKSSLSGILTSLEKRKIITKRERGRTNVIELSDRFLNVKEQS